MTLRDQVSDDVTSVFLNEDDFATEVAHWPLGDSTASVAVVGVFAEDSGPEIESYGNRLVRRAVLELAASTTVTTGEANRSRDVFLINGVAWGAVRVIGQDDDMQSILLERHEPKGTPPR